MNTRKLFTLVLVVGMIIPAAGTAVTAQTNSTPMQTAASGSADSGETVPDASNYTRLYIDDRHQSLELKPGESTTFTVTIENGEDESVEITPQVFIPPRGERPIETDWVTIEDGNTTLDAGEEREFEFTVSVPDDAELNRYGGMIAFTDETISYPGQPARPVHSASLNVEVWKEPTVHILSDTHTYTQVKAGDSFTREIVVENTGDEAVPVNPQLQNEQQRHAVRYPPNSREMLDRSWLTIDAPNEIAPGETATIEVTVAAPSDAERGDYRAELDLGLKDPARPDRNGYWQEVSIGFQVWSQPDEPFETSFDVSDDAEDITLELSADQVRRGMSEMESPNFDVTFVSPTGDEIDAQRVRVTNSGHVNLGAERRPMPTDDSTYSSGAEGQTFSYRVEDPTAGTWSVQITPENTMQFGYDIIREESN
jgi:uncharacterized cupredoxin-like copper-binding protein